MDIFKGKSILITGGTGSLLIVARPTDKATNTEWATQDDILSMLED